MRTFLRLKLWSLVVAGAAVMLLASTAMGQCSMCRAALGGANNAFFIRNFNIGVLVLLLPPVTIFCSIFIALKRYRSADESEETDPEDAVDSTPKA